MPEYLSPGVYVEETSYRAKSIEGVATSTCGFVGQCAFGPTSGLPPLVTSFEEFRRTFGGLQDLVLEGAGPTTNYLAHAVRAFFENGGKRVYVARVFNIGTSSEDELKAGVPIDSSSPTLLFRARFPGAAGNLEVKVEKVVSKDIRVVKGTSTVNLAGLRVGDLVATGTNDDADAWWQQGPSGARFLTRDGTTPEDLSTLSSPVRKVSYRVTVDDAVSCGDLSTHPASASFILTVLRDHEPYDSGAQIAFVESADTAGTFGPGDALSLARALDAFGTKTLTGGGDGALMDSDDISPAAGKSGLAALAEIEDIAIVAAPGAAALEATEQQTIRDALISHCTNLKYRFAILSASASIDPNRGSQNEGLDSNAIRAIRAQHDSSYAALYYPWVVVNDPNGERGETLLLPPDGFMAGIFARSDIERGVHKAPANEVVRGALRFSINVPQGQQDALNPEGINCLRFFEGRGYRCWGARTISSDPEWKYVNVRRLFIYLEHSIDRATQWAVFEPNNEALWLKVRMTIESFLIDTWRTGALMGKEPKQAFFVRCDRTTMTQGDLDNGRLICLIGVAPTKPAEFVIFRIGQWTAEASIL